MGLGHGRIFAAAALALAAGTVLVPRTAPGSTVSEQRARLPPKADCDDPVVGVWKSHNYNDVYEQWTEFTLEIRRVQPGAPQLEGRILNHSWHGSRTLVQAPPTCDKIDLRYQVSMDGRGTADGEAVDFGGVGSWRMDQIFCGSTLGFGYNLDRFTGTIDPELQEFQSVNNDGGISINEPTVFRRIRCYEGPAPVEDVEPPPFQPPGARGCGLW